MSASLLLQNSWPIQQDTIPDCATIRHYSNEAADDDDYIPTALFSAQSWALGPISH